MLRKKSILEVIPKSDLKPFAQDESLCVVGSELVCTFYTKYAELLKSHYYSDLFKCFVVLLIDNSLRVSEVLKINYKVISSNYSIVIQSSKGSHNRVIQAKLYQHVLSELRDNRASFSDFFNRWHIYRELKKLHLYTGVVGNERMSVTHAARHINAVDLYSVSADIESVKMLLGHKSSKSSLYYVKPLR